MMITPEIAKTTVEKIKGVVPFFAEKGPKKGVAHLDKAYRFGYSGRHIAIVRNATQAGITIYLNQSSVSERIFPEDSFRSSVVAERYAIGHKGKANEDGIASFAKNLPSINPEFNASMRISVSTKEEFQLILDWYFSINEISSKDKFEDIEASIKNGSSQNSSKLAIAESVQDCLERDTANLSTSEREAVVKVRFGQGVFRSLLLDIAGEVCWMSGIEGKALLIASHIQPWSHCEKNLEARRCPDNGLLLSSLWDAAFDAGLITFDEDWRVKVSPELSESAKKNLGLEQEMFLPERFRNFPRSQYLTYHRAVVFKP